METLELTSKSLEEARQAAAEQWGVASDRVDVQVIEEVKGLFGKASVKVQATLKPEAPAKGKKPARSSKAAEPEPPVEAQPEPAPATKKAPRAEKAKAKPAKSAPAEPVAASEEPEEDEPREAVVATQADADAMIAIIDEILELGDLEAEVQLKSLNERYVNLELYGRDVAFLVGKHGEVLNALQYLVNVISTRQHGSGVRASLDGNSYRNRREEALTRLAEQIAEQVRDRGEEAVLDALPAFERRVIHKALQEMEGITTYSEGEEPQRRVVIAPAT